MTRPDPSHPHAASMTPPGVRLCRAGETWTFRWTSGDERRLLSIAAALVADPDTTLDPLGLDVLVQAIARRGSASRAGPVRPAV
ncbi:MAG: hypothetical protein KDA25_00295 [Phycisphaerales bacterium]|nr:hypothetical protein [Phycisphaerales bacterium]